MFALKSAQVARKEVDVTTISRAANVWDGLVLPRWLRRPARVLGRLLGGEVGGPG